MKWLTIIVLLLATSFDARADLPHRNYPYTLRSANNEYYLRSIPYVTFGNMGKTYVYNNKTGKQLYTVDMYFDQTVFLSNDGQNIIWVSFWNGQDGKGYKNIYGYAICFYRQSEMTRSYKIQDLVNEHSKLSYSVSHVQWRYDLSQYDQKRKEWIVPTDSVRTRMERYSAYTSNDTLYTTTVEDKTIAFYIPTGEIVKKINAKKFFKAKNNYSFPASFKEKLPDFNKHPRDLPLLANEEGDLSYALAYLLNYKRAFRDNYHDVIITIKLILDKQTGMIDKLEIEGKTATGDIALNSDAIRQKILDWLKDKRFKTAELASWVEKWYYNESYYFTYQ